MPGIFGTLGIANKGLQAQQAAIDVTSHNISNANTDGYTRQRAVLQASKPYAMPSFDGPSGAGQMGTGVDVASIERVRDSFLDYQIRNQNSINGQYSTLNTILGEVEDIYNVTSSSGISTSLSDFFNAWQSLSSAPESDSARTEVVQATQALTDQFNSVSSQLSDLKNNTQTEIQNNVYSLNNVLDQLNTVNTQIMDISVSGQNPNDLMDKRDSLLDELSTKFGIKISDKSLNGIEVTTSDSGSVPLDSSGNAINLVQVQSPDSTSRFSYINSITNSSGSTGYNGAGVYTIAYYKNGDMTSEANKVTIKVNLTSEDQYNQLNESRTLWADNSGNALKVSTNTNGTVTASGTLANNSTCNFSDLKLFQPSTGELNGYMSAEQDIDSYSSQLDSLAKAVALSVNAVHSQSSTWTADTSTTLNNIFVNKDDSASAAGESNITAANISVNSELLSNAMLIQTGVSSTSGESDGNRALAIAQIADKLMTIQNINPETYSRESLVSLSADSTLGGVLSINSNTDGMTLDTYFQDSVDKLGTQSQQAQRMVSNQQTLLSSLQNNKESVSGVSLDEEASNLIQYQHAYQANAKVIATVDELLDVIVNGLKK